MKADRQRQREQRSGILGAAAGFVAAHGYHGMSMRALAKATGKGVSSLYNYFSSKEEILFALQKEELERLTASAGGALKEVRDPAVRLYVFISHHVRHFSAHPDVMRILVHEAGSLPPPRRRLIRRLKERYFEMGRSIVRQLIEQGCDTAGAAGRRCEDPAELDRLTYSLFGMLNWIYGWYRPESHGSPEDLARSIHRLALCGLVARCPFRQREESMERHLRSVPGLPLLGGVGARGPAP